ncbi:MalY/PatB family protein [Hydrogenovibrio marinus]|uniref:cysteine-S-conjugate beta-lyase n=1 Tax=Hydrogenovibrio marinus TaxID=28885 RepID=A0A066ZP66_HYDMR|nr:PatB family C-S lyase [Hydrogenovibrio marinus]KDN95603.1 aminotransferase class I/II [Hydrogenovibrio marinus]BBN60098.1 cystathionine beta-lyase [Hydrogenovibrio marinus]
MADFNRVFPREDTDAEKYALRKALFGREDILPMWVADMDLPTPNFIMQAIKTRLEHPILGYTHMSEAVYQAIIDWQAFHEYEVKSEEIVFTHNVANGFFMAVQAFTKAGEAVLAMPPVYPPFLTAPELNGRKLVTAPLVLKNGRYEIDFDLLESKIVENKVQLILFCHPQNPSGRVWTENELKKLAEICVTHKVTIVSDEIHSDMIFSGKHIPLATISDAIRQQTITLSSPGKTFNLGGLQIGYAIIANPKLKAAYLKVSQSVSVKGLNLFATVALEAAYSEKGRRYVQELNQFLQQNIDKTVDFFQTHFPQVTVMRPEASYLVWLDFSTLCSDHAALKNWIINDAKLGLNDGESFDVKTDKPNAGTCFMRMNLAVPPRVLQQAFSHFKMGLNQLPKL